MDEQLQILIQNLFDSEDNTGCSEDLTVVGWMPIFELREYMIHYHLGGGSGVKKKPEKPVCKLCLSELDENGFCTYTSLDEVCPYDSRQQNHPICHKCGSLLDQGFCIDETCPYYDWNQEVPVELFEIELTTMDIVDNCHDHGIPVRLSTKEQRASNDLFECMDCHDTFDIDCAWLKGFDMVCEACRNKRREKSS